MKTSIATNMAKKYPAPVKEHGLHLNVAGTATATATKNDAQVNAIKKPICTCNMRIRLLLAGWLADATSVAAG